MVILILPILIGIFIYFYALNINKLQSDEINQNVIKSVKEKVDNQITKVNQTFNHMIFNSNLQMLSIIKDNFTTKDQYRLFDLHTNLKTINVIEDEFEDIFVYFTNTERICSARGNMSLPFYYNLYKENQNFTLEEMEAYLSEFHYNDVLYVPDENNNDYFLFTMTSLKIEIGEDSATLGIIIDADMIGDLLHSMLVDKRITIMILDNKNQIISSTLGEDVKHTLKYDELIYGEDFRSDIEGINYIGSTLNSDYLNWKYVILTPKHVIEENARKIQIFAIIGLFSCILVGSFLSYQLTKRNYNPLNGLLELFGFQVKDETVVHVNEYQWLKKRAEDFLQENIDTKKTLHRNQRILKDYYLFRLLEYSYDEEQFMAGRHQYLGNLRDSYYIVMIFHMGDFPDSNMEIMPFEQENGLRKFIVKNIFQEGLSEDFNIVMTEMGEVVAAIVNVSQNDSVVMEKIKEIVENLQQIIKEKFEFDMVTLVGNIHEGIEGVHTSYQEAREAEEYITLLDANILFYDEIKNVNKKYYYPIQIEEKIINTIRTGDSEKSCEYLNQILDVNYSENKISPEMYKYLLFDLMGTIMKGMDEIGYNLGFFDDTHLIKQISVKLPLSQVKEKFRMIIENISNETKKTYASQNNQLSEQIKGYIQGNYQDPDLNISQTSLHFKMTPNYISTIFKNQTGDSLLKYINTVRIEEAKRLLEQDYSVIETAEKVGFRDSGSFIRVFKNFTGITPGQLKKMQ